MAALPVTGTITHAAAVCYRRTRGLEFLLVRTRAGNRWVFPKGHVEPSDPSPAAAAGREALEEGIR